MASEKIQYIESLIANKQSELRSIDRKFNKECSNHYSQVETELNLLEEILKDLHSYYSEDYN